MNEEDQRLPNKIKQALPFIKIAISLIVSSLKRHGHLFFFGAGTSGRFGILEAAECPPTFNTPPHLIQAYMAGGKPSVFRSKEGAEDCEREASRIVKQKVNSNDVVVGIAASGVTAFVKRALIEARKKKAATIFITCNPQVNRSLANVVIVVDTGPEIIAGSTRLKAGTATKLVLNMLTVGAMTQMGKVYGHLMVDLQPRSRKLKARAVNLIMKITGVSLPKAKAALRRAKGQTKTAIVMLKRRLSYKQAHRELKMAQGRLDVLLRKQNKKTNLKQKVIR